MQYLQINVRFLQNSVQSSQSDFGLLKKIKVLNIVTIAVSHAFVDFSTHYLKICGLLYFIKNCNTLTFPIAAIQNDSRSQVKQ